MSEFRTMISRTLYAALVAEVGAESAARMAIVEPYTPEQATKAKRRLIHWWHEGKFFRGEQWTPKQIARMKDSSLRNEMPIFNRVESNNLSR